MPKTLQFRRGSTSELSTVTGAVGELFVDTTKDTVVVMDGTTAGGTPLATETALTTGLASKADSSALTTGLAGKQNSLVSGTSIKTINNQSLLGSGNINITGSGSSFSGSYNDLTDKPTLITSYNDLTDKPTSFNNLTLGGHISITGYVTDYLGQVQGPDTNYNSILTSDGGNAVRWQNLKTINGNSIVGAGDITITGGGGGSADFSAVPEDILPLFSEVYDIGSENKRFHDGYFTNKIDIGSTTLVSTQETVNNVLERSLTTNADIVTPRVVATEAYVGNILYENATLTPDADIGQYVDVKGTVTVDGSVSIADDLQVRNKISIKQTPLSSGEVIGFSTTPAVSGSLEVTDTYAQAHGITRIYFSQAGQWNTIQFNSSTEADSFAAQVSLGTATFTMWASGTAFTFDFTISQWSHSAGNASVDFLGSVSSGTPPWNYTSYDNWWFSWYTSSNYRTTSAAFPSIIPATYSVQFARAVPALGTVNNLYINDSTTYSSQVTTTFSNYVNTFFGSNVSMYINNIQFLQSTYGHAFRINYMMGSTWTLMQSFTSLTPITLTYAGTGDTWVLDIVLVYDDMMYGPLAYYTVRSTTSIYPTPQDYTAYYQPNDLSFTATQSTSYKTTLSAASLSITQPNTYTSNTDIRPLFSIGDALTYTTTSTQIVFGDPTSQLSKSITYNEVTGSISYGGLVQSMLLDTSTNTIRSSNANTTNANNAILIGNIASASGSNAVSMGYNAQANGNNSVAIGQGASATGNNGVAIGSDVRSAGGQSSTYIGGGDNIGSMYHSTVVGMQGTGSNGWMWGGGQHVAVLGTQNNYLNYAGDYSTIINGGNSSSHLATGNLIGGSTSFAPQDKHAVMTLSCYQYAYVSGTSPIYPQFGYGASTGAPMQVNTSASTSNNSTLRIDQNNNQLIQGKVILTLQVRNLDVWGIYEISFIARRDTSGTMSIVSQSTTALGNNNASTYWNTPVLYLNSGKLQFQVTPTSSLNNQYLTIHVSGDVNVGIPY